MQNLPIADFEYELPDEQIARFPLTERDASKLLVYRKGQITHAQFPEIVRELSEDTLLVFNNTRVIPARLHFQRVTGAQIELFLLHPVEPSTVIPVVMEESHACVWECMIGNRKRWKSGEVLQKELTIDGQSVILSAELVSADESLVRLSWTNEIRFVDVVQAIGKIPLPPYLKREAEEADLETYQTVYSEKQGAVAAPTAGLHFTDRVFEALDKKGIKREFLTLHVGAGTFQPVKTENALEHKMHGEQLVITQANLEHLLQASRIIPVGTTSMRSLESMYWLGVQVIQGKYFSFSDGFYITQFIHQEYADPELPTKEEAFRAILKQMQAENRMEIVGETQIMIFPGYQFRVCQGLVTNFHQPGSTLLLLIAALIGDDWKRMYAEALTNNYRFLSYGDSSLLLPFDL
ncbi:S-adenosylmethionine:tRNA ribosyltransferase-isomerase [Siphonobacter sp. SORGH_AS_1065]|uniref:S-adenosylmethionine:tRNA ribosyltransferase-isomerase n=1 Tax=Siphonobacter sp. SORGH_AS_1065 TaxID=3041795 RepID=UPI00278A4924|nr:S-adenosylmethionine:tRNA ribosyltransferase-isomerase [Siphonobacter sp. SORGH_AS_1065]MDQ1088659.1 S-adenosylmethionine:tRNA ribosyltransferase-isomerase [Siphonobacter sp. SORGH_AS_1065]